MDTAKKLVHLEVVKEMADQEINVLKEILLTDPTRINSAIDIWTKKKQKASPEEQARCDKNIANLYDILEKAIETTLKVYDIESNQVAETTDEVVSTTEKEPTMVHQPPTATEEPETQQEDRSKTALRIVKDNDDLAEKYKDIIKKLSVDDLKKHLITLTQEDANQAAHYILSNGLYHATNPKRWNDKKVNGFLKEVAKAKAKKEGVQKIVSESVNLDEKYKDSIGKYTLAEIGEIIRDYVSNDKAAEALEFATYLLSKKAYKDSEKEDIEWTSEAITTFIDQVVTGMSSETTIEEATIVSDESELQKKYKGLEGKLTLDVISKKIFKLHKDGKSEEALELATYLLTDKKYKGADEDDLEWTNEKIIAYVKKITDGITENSTESEIDTEAPFYDITSSELYTKIHTECNKEGATKESVKQWFLSFAEKNSEKSIQPITSLLKKGNTLDEIWNKQYDLLVDHIFEGIAKNAELEAKRQNEVKEKEAILADFESTYLPEKKKDIESGTIRLRDVIVDLKQKMIDKGITPDGVFTLANTIKDLAYRAAINVKWAKTPEETPSQSETETDSPESVAIIGPKVSVDDKFPEIKAEVENAKYLEDMYFLSKKYTSDEEKNAYILQLIANAFADKKVFETSKAEQPLDWTIEQVQAWLNTEMTTTEAVVDAQTDLNPKTDDSETEEVAEDVVNTDKESNVEQTKESKSEWQKTFCAANNREKFVNAVVDFVKKSKEEGKEIKAIRSECAELIQFAARNDKKSFARSSYKRVQIGELHNAINRIAIAAEIDGFMNEPKH